MAEKSGLEMNKLPLKSLKLICDQFDNDIFEISNFRSSIEQYSVVGGTSTSSVKSQIDFLKNFVLDLVYLNKI